MIHLDVKPSNIVIVDGTAKLIDFGGMLDTRDSGNQIIAGTYKYLSPGMYTTSFTKILERVSSCKIEEYTPEIDIWALGLVFIELLCGTSDIWPHVDANQNDILAYIKNGEHFKKIPHTTSSSVIDLIQSCLQL